MKFYAYEKEVEKVLAKLKGAGNYSRLALAVRQFAWGESKFKLAKIYI